jgi:hypothetical protein
MLMVRKMTTPRKLSVASATKSASPDPWKEWGLLFFGSAGVGIVAVILLLSAVLLVVGLYVQLVWPLTDWDLGNISLGDFNSIATTVMAGIFLGGFGAGYWCISGGAWKNKKTGRPANTLQKASVRTRH